MKVMIFRNTDIKYHMQVLSVRESGWVINHCYFLLSATLKWLAIDFTLRVVLVECHITGTVICYSNGCQWTSHSVLFLWNATLLVPLSQNLVLH